MRFVLVGRTGAGKSTTGNSILLEYDKVRRPFRVSVGGSSSTAQCLLIQKFVLGRTIRVVDTPGLFDTNSSKRNDEILLEISKCLILAYPGPHVILMVVKGGDRVTHEYQETIELVQQIFGSDVRSYMMLAVTAVDQLEEEGYSLEEWLKTTPPCVRDIAFNTGGGYIGFNNRLTGFNNENQVKHLFSTVENMLRRNGQSYYSSLIYQEMHSVLSEAGGRSEENLLKILKDIEQNRRIAYGPFYGMLKRWMRVQTHFRFQNLDAAINRALCN